MVDAIPRLIDAWERSIACICQLSYKDTQRGLVYNFPGPLFHT